MSRNLPDRPVTVIFSRKQARMLAKTCGLNEVTSASLVERKSWSAAGRRIRDALERARQNGAGR